MPIKLICNPKFFVCNRFFLIAKIAEQIVYNSRSTLSTVEQNQANIWNVLEVVLVELMFRNFVKLSYCLAKLEAKR